ncbi:MAG: DUF5054 domain-containing protein, partial [Anaerolineales bacterium]
MTPAETQVDVIHVIFKTHLDVGFTDLARNVVAQYRDTYIPAACQAAQALREAGRPERFIWTTGSWLVFECLEEASPQERKALEEAIWAGDITWHGLPFTTHSELMDASLFKHGLSLSQALDRRFGKQTIAAKMTDVPGHTRAMVPLLAEAGIQFLHIGINEASTPPQVPPVFVWRDKDQADVVVIVQHSYGDLLVVPGMAYALAFAHTYDNQGPQSMQGILEVFQKLRAQFPQAKIVASNLNAYAQELLKLKSQLPVVTAEIGDTWIHGAGTDPKKISQFREMCRLRSQWISEKRAELDAKSWADFSGHLLMVPEHTWGLDEKTHLDDTLNYGPDQLAKARQQATFKAFESSWAEQRAYLHQAVEALGSSSLADEVRERLIEIAPVAPDRAGLARVPDLSTIFDTHHFVLRFDAASGAICQLTDKRTGRQLASEDCPLGLFRYQTF